MPMMTMPKPSSKRWEDGTAEVKVLNRKPPICDGCGANLSDPPSKLCSGCQAYQDHQR